MDTTTFNPAFAIFALITILIAYIAVLTCFAAARNMKSWYVDVLCWWKGYERVNVRQEAFALKLDRELNNDDMPELDEIAPREATKRGPIRPVRRKQRAPFAAWLVQTIRGSHLSQCKRTDSNVLVFERHARSIMSEHGVRPTDAAALLPYATALFFEHRSDDQIDAVAITYTDVFKSTVNKYEAAYYYSGRASAHAEA